MLGALALGLTASQQERVRRKLRCSEFVLRFKRTPRTSVAATGAAFLVVSSRHYEQAILYVIVLTENQWRRFGLCRLHEQASSISQLFSAHIVPERIGTRVADNTNDLRVSNRGCAHPFGAESRHLDRYSSCVTCDH